VPTMYIKGLRLMMVVSPFLLVYSWETFPDAHGPAC